MRALKAEEISVVRLSRDYGASNGVCISVPAESTHIAQETLSERVCDVYLTQREARILLNRLAKVVNDPRRF